MLCLEKGNYNQLENMVKKTEPNTLAAFQPCMEPQLLNLKSRSLKACTSP